METDTLVQGWQYLRFLWAVAGLGVALAMGVVVWRVRGLLNWKRSQRRELAELKKQRDLAEDAYARALDEVIEACEGIWRSATPDLGRLSELPMYWRRVAAPFYPQDPQPELNLSIGQLLAAAQQLATGLDGLLKRPGFHRLGRLRIRQLRRTFNWYRQFSDHPAVAWIMARRRVIGTFWHTLRFVLPDPLAWLAYLSQRLTVMMAARCLLMDVYLYTGKVALGAFDRQRQSAPASETVPYGDEIPEVEESLFDETSQPDSAELAELRRRLVGIPARLWNPPGVDECRQAVKEAAQLIAAEYFPAAPDPLEEARCQVLLNRGRYWLQAMAEARDLPVVKPLYQVSLRRLMQIKSLSESDLLRRGGQIASGAWTAWRWTRWPLKVLRWARRRSAAGVAVDVGFTLAGKAALNYLARRGFDLACRDLNLVFRQSALPHGEGVADGQAEPPKPSTDGK